MSNKNKKNHFNDDDGKNKNDNNTGEFKSSLGGEFEVEKQTNTANNDNLNQSSDAMQDLVTTLKEQIEQMQAKFSEDKQKLLLAIADRDNTIKRIENDKKDSILFSNQSLLKSLIEPLEYLFLALVQKPDENSSQDYKNIYLGVDMTKTQFTSALEKAGLKRVFPSIGDAFNPLVHEAISVVEDEKLTSNTIQNVAKAGYELNGRIIKPSLVIVVK